jgi:uncharacterized protein
MELAINYSRQAAKLVEDGKILLDRFKCPDWPELIEEASKVLPVYVHFAINAGSDDSQTKDWGVADRLAHTTNTPFVNLHLAARASDFASGEAVVTRLHGDVARAVGFFGADRVIVENIPLGNPEENFALQCVDAAVIKEVVAQGKCGFLLDLSHARLTARHLGIDEREYISALPLDRMCELHLTGLQIVDGRLRDHMGMTEEDWQITQWAFEQIRLRKWKRPRIVAFEYGGVGEKFAWRCDPAVIASQIPRLYELVHRMAGN